MPTQPLVRSPKCTLPSRPRVMPSCAAHVLGEDPPRLDAADDVGGEVAVQDAQAVLRRPSPRSPRRTRPPGRTRRRSSPAPCPAGRASSRAPRCRASSASRAAARPGPRWSGARLRRAVSSVRAVSVAIWRFLSLRGFCAPPGIARGAPVRAGGISAAARVDGAIQPIRHGGFTLDADDGRVREVAAAALAAARGVAVARVRRADRRRRGPGRAAAVPGRGPDAIGALLVAGVLQPARGRAAGAAVRACCCAAAGATCRS